MATGTGNLPNQGMSFTPFDILTAAEMNQLVANIESLATGVGIGDGSIGTSDIANSSVTPAKFSLPQSGFRARRTATLNITTSYTMITFNTEDFDIGGNYDTSTGRYTATTSGYYEFRAVVTAATVGRMTTALYKNGAVYSYGTDGFVAAGSGATIRSLFNDLIFLNSGEYVDMRAAADTTRAINQTESFFSGNIVWSV